MTKKSQVSNFKEKSTFGGHLPFHFFEPVQHDIHGIRRRYLFVLFDHHEAVAVRRDIIGSWWEE